MPGSTSPMPEGGGSASEPAAFADDEQVRRHVLSGFGWNMFGVGIAQVSQILVGLLLVRLLTPRDYGLAGMALMFSSLALLMSDVSMGSALVQRREITEADRCTVFWTSAAIGTLLTIAGIALSWPLADFYRRPEVRPLFAAVSMTFVLMALQTTQQALLQRDMKFRLIQIRIAIGVVVGAVVGVTVALLGGGPWALVLQQVASTAIGTLLLWTFSSWRPRLIFSRRSLRDLGGFGVHLFGSQLSTYGKGNADNVLVGRFLGSAALGIYGVAYNLMFLPLMRVVIPIQETLFPAFSRWQDDHRRLGGVWLRVLRVVAAVLAPLMVGIVIVAPDFVAVVMGHKWRPAVPVLQLLAMVSLAQALALLGGRVLAATNRTRLVLRFSLLDAVLTIAAFAVGLRWGIVGVSFCYLVVSVPLQVLFVVLTARAVGVTAAQVGRTLAGVAVSTALMGIGCLGARFALLSVGVGPAPRLALVVAVGIVIYGTACVLLEREVVGELRNVRARRQRRPLAVPA